MPTQPLLCHHSPGVDVEIFWLERVDDMIRTIRIPMRIVPTGI
jgi:hypothetical protein